MSNRPLFVIALVAAASGMAYTAMAAPSPAADAAAIGPAVGSHVALNHALIDSTGHPTTLAKVAGGHPVMVVFFRSAAWCPFCQQQLKGLGPVATATRAKGVRLIGVSYDKPETLAGFGTKAGLDYPLYSDAGSRMIDAFKLRDPQYKGNAVADGVPYATTLLIDGKGVVKAKSVATDYKVRITPADQVAMLQKL